MIDALELIRRLDELKARIERDQARHRGLGPLAAALDPIEPWTAHRAVDEASRIAAQLAKEPPLQPGVNRVD